MRKGIKKFESKSNEIFKTNFDFSIENQELITNNLKILHSIMTKFDKSEIVNEQLLVWMHDRTSMNLIFESQLNLYIERSLKLIKRNLKKRLKNRDVNSS